MIFGLFAFVVALSVCAAPAGASQTLAGPYVAAVERVVDGDTIRARVMIWLGQDLSILVRIRGIDAPELRGRCEGEKASARDAAAALERLVSQGTIVLTQIEGGKYFGRVVADVATSQGLDVAATLVAGGYARAYGGGARGDWCEVGLRGAGGIGNLTPDGAQRNPG